MNLKPVRMFWAACGACGETWSVNSNPDWLTYEEALDEVRFYVRQHARNCEVRNVPDVDGFV